MCGEMCDARYVGNEGQLCCKITGRVLASMLAPHPTMPVMRVDVCTVATPRRRRRRRRGGDASREQRRSSACRRIVRELLFGFKRAILAKQRKSAMMRNIRRDVQRAQEKGGGKCDEKTAREIVAHHAKACNVIARLAYDEKTLEEISGAVLRVDTRARTSPYYHAHPTTIHFGDVVLGCCYLMQQGLAYDGQCFVPKLTCLVDMLPRINDLGALGFRVRQVTIGKNHLMKAFRSTRGTLTQSKAAHPAAFRVPSA